MGEKDSNRCKLLLWAKMKITTMVFKEIIATINKKWEKMRKKCAQRSGIELATIRKNVLVVNMERNQYNRCRLLVCVHVRYTYRIWYGMVFTRYWHNFKLSLLLHITQESIHSIDAQLNERKCDTKILQKTHSFL